MPIAIRYLKISNYRSIDELELHDIPAFAVFAGANGSGKSNFFNALDFMSSVIKFGINIAVKQQVGIDNIHHIKQAKMNLDVDSSLSFTISNQHTEEYNLKILEPPLGTPYLRESMSINGVEIASRDATEYKNILFSHDFWQFLFANIINGRKPKSKKRNTLQSKEFRQSTEYIARHMASLSENLSLQPDISMFKSLYRIPTVELGIILQNIRLYNIEPRAVKSFDYSTIYDDSELQRYGQNLAAVLRRLEKDDEMRETIIDWLQLIVPQLEIVRTETERLSGSAQLAFKEKGKDKLFPAHLISDGTIYLLCLLVAMLDRPKAGITLIEEPERGLHPKAIMELVQAFREHATIESPIWLTTHSESVVRMLKDNELWFVDKKDGKTQINPVRNINELSLNLDEAWLSNALNGGLPW